ncbi:MAG: hypothetical protein QOJ52_3587 [Acidimicrobiaceae bacterium]|nr:hypothetical protein [Acidimicrobiaceae bacterium]
MKRRLIALLLGGLVSTMTMVVASPPAQAAVPYSGPGFDACTAPSTSTMSAWLASPYRSLGIYIGGANRACGDGNLSASWVSTVEGMGWRLAPLYVGLQAPCVDQQGLATIDPAQASIQGTQAADDAVLRAQNFGLGAGTPIYFDMEAYAAGCSADVLAFVNAWTVELHAKNYLSGIYGSASSAIVDEASVYGTAGQVDDIWFARWNNVPNIYGEPYVSNTKWTNRQRIHQFLNSQDQTFGGVTINIDLDTSDGGFAGICGGQAPTCSTPIQAHYAQLGGAGSFLGAPVGAEVWLSDGVGKYQSFANGYIYWSPFTGAHEIHGSILSLYAATGFERGPLGYPITDAAKTADGSGRYNHFQNGSIYWSPATGTYEVHGSIRSKYGSLGWEQSFLGFPTSSTLVTATQSGRYNLFQGGAIYWSAATDAHEVHGSIRDKWASLGWELGFLGYPVTDAAKTAAGTGRYNHFQGGSIYWSPASGTHEVHGAIRDEWAARGWEQGLLGFPVSDTLLTARADGRYSAFQGGAIYWSPVSGAHEVHGPIFDKWASLGWELGPMGYPTADQAGVGDGVGQFGQFQNGSIYWTAQGGAAEVHGAIWNTYLGGGGPGSSLGYPTGDPIATTFGAQSNFQHGTIVWCRFSGATVVNGSC